MKNKMSYEELEKALEESNKLCSKMNMKYINEKNKNDKAIKYIENNSCIYEWNNEIQSNWDGGKPHILLEILRRNK